MSSYCPRSNHCACRTFIHVVSVAGTTASVPHLSATNCNVGTMSETGPSPKHGTTQWKYALTGGLGSPHSPPPSYWQTGSELYHDVGTFIAGVIATNRPTDSDAAGFRAGFLAGVVGVSTFIMTVVSDALSSSTAAWPLSRVVFSFSSVCCEGVIELLTRQLFFLSRSIRIFQ